MNRVQLDRAIRFFAYPAAVYVAGVIWSAIDNFLLDHFEPKFSRGGSFVAALLAFGVIASIALPAGAIGLLLFRRRAAGLPVGRFVLVGSVAAVAVVAVLAAGALERPSKWMADRVGGEPVMATGMFFLLLVVTYVAALLAGSRT